MRFSIFQYLVVIFFLFLLVTKTLAQEPQATIELGETSFVIERPFTISVIIPNADSRPQIAFPTIKGMIKRGTSTSVTTNTIDGKPVSSQIVTQNYMATAPGQYWLEPFTIRVNNQTLQSGGATLVVRGSASASTPVPAAPKPPRPNDAFLSLSASREDVFVGEGFNVKLSFFVAEAYPFQLNFYEVEKQLQQILKRLRPANCWEENTGITELRPIPVTVGGRRFTEYKIYEAFYFPLNRQPIRLPSVSLRMSRIRPGATPGAPARQDYVSFISRTLSVAIRPLPPHPLRDRVPVGQYRFSERISRPNPAIGQSVAYTVRLEGEGNIASLTMPPVAVVPALDIFPPEAKQTIQRGSGAVTGSKTFRYLMVPRLNGNVGLDSLFRFIYFDPRRQQYDTLQSAVTLRVGGLNLMSEDTVKVGLPGSIYTGIEQMNSAVQPLNVYDLIRMMANVVLIVMILGMMYLFWRK